MFKTDFIKILYKLANKSLQIMDFGDNNIINSESAKNAFLLGSGCIEINGSNNQINIEPTVRFKGCKIKLSGDNIVLTIGKNCKFNNLYAVFSGTKDYSKKIRITIGDNFENIEDLQMFAGGYEDSNIEIGDNCLFSRRIAIYAHDGHNIYDKSSDTVINVPKKSLKIGDNVWVGHGVQILKNSQIADNSVVGAGSVVSGCFEKGNVIIAGNPAKVIKENIYWKK